jgi:hypothetical protein
MREKLMVFLRAKIAIISVRAKYFAKKQRMQAAPDHGPFLHPRRLIIIYLQPLPSSKELGVAFPPSLQGGAGGRPGGGWV